MSGNYSERIFINMNMENKFIGTAYRIDVVKSKTAKTIKPFVTKYRGYVISIPVGSIVTNKTSIDCDDNYRFWVDFEKECERLTGFKNSILQHDLSHYGLNIPKEFCEPYPVYSEKKEKTKKQKCLEMWQWLEANPALSKIDYLDYLIEEKRKDEFKQCWACEEAEDRAILNGFNLYGICRFCPVWLGEKHCLMDKDPYDLWDKSEIPEERKLHASQIVEMIEKNWKD